MSGPPYSGLPKFNIALTAYQWTAVAVGAPFAIMLAIKVSWEVFSWWAGVVFESETAVELATGLFVFLSWIGGFSVAVTLFTDGLITFSIRKRS